MNKKIKTNTKTMIDSEANKSTLKEKTNDIFKWLCCGSFDALFLKIYGYVMGILFICVLILLVCPIFWPLLIICIPVLLVLMCCVTAVLIVLIVCVFLFIVCAINSM